MMTTVLRKHTKQYHHKSRFTRYLQYFRDVGPSLIVTNCTLDFANSTLGFARAFGENSKLVGLGFKGVGEPRPCTAGIFF